MQVETLRTRLANALKMDGDNILGGKIDAEIRSKETEASAKRTALYEEVREAKLMRCLALIMIEY